MEYTVGHIMHWYGITGESSILLYRLHSTDLRKASVSCDGLTHVQNVSLLVCDQEKAIQSLSGGHRSQRREGGGGRSKIYTYNISNGRFSHIFTMDNISLKSHPLKVW